MELGALIKKSLITISHGNIEMHDLLEEMGREIVVKESPNKPGKRSRLWRQEEVQNILKYDEGTNAVQGIVLDLLNIKDMQLSPQAFKKMYNLRFLKFDSKYYYGPYNSKLHFPNGLSDLSSKLRSLIWHGFPLTALPSNFNPENLVELHLRDSSIERLWEGTMHAPNLKLLILRGCKHLTNIPNLSDALLLERIDLKCCQSLLDFPLLAPHLKYLHFLDLQGCKSLRSFPSDIHFESLTSLELNDHANLTKFPEISGDLILLDLSGTAIDEVPPSIGSLTKLSNLNLSNCTRLKRISIDIFKLNSLCNLNLSNCSGLESFPGDISHLSSLIFLDLSGSDFESLPKSMNQLSNLKELEVNNCNMLQSLTELPLSLELLSAIDCKQLRSIPDASELVKAKFIFTNCRNLEETAVGNILATVEGYEGELYSFTFCCPGSEVPEWFSYRSNKSYIDLRMARQDCFDGLFPGFIACAVIEFEEYCSNDKFADELCVLCSWYESGAFIEGYESDELNDFSCTLITGSSLGTLINSDHVALWYCKALDRQVLESEYTDITFEFWLAEGGNCRVISCGVRPIKICGVTIEDIGETSGKRSRTSNDHREEYFDEVSDEDDKVIYAEPIKTSGVTIEDIGETSGKRSRTSNDHREEEVEPHSKRLNLDLSL